MAPEPPTDPVMDIGLPLLVAVLIAGMAATTTVKDYMAAIRKPQAMICGMLSQFVAMPIIAIALSKAFGLRPEHAIGLIIVGCTPGGTTSNLFAFWADGDVSLSLAMTITSTVVALFVMAPLLNLYTDVIGQFVTELNDDQRDSCVGKVTPSPTDPTLRVTDKLTLLYPRPSGDVILRHCWDSATGSEMENDCNATFAACYDLGAEDDVACFARGCDAKIEVETGMIAPSLALLLVCVGLGLMANGQCFCLKTVCQKACCKCCRNCCPCPPHKWVGQALASLGSSLGMIVVFVLIVYGASIYKFVWEASWQIWICAILIGNLGFICGYAFAFAAQLTRRQCRTVSLETGIQNGPLAIAVAAAAFQRCNESIDRTDECIQSQVLVFPYMYSVWIVLQSILVTQGIYAQTEVVPPPEPPAVQSAIVDDQGRVGESFKTKGHAPRRALGWEKELLDVGHPEAEKLVDILKRYAKEKNGCCGGGGGAAQPPPGAAIGPVSKQLQPGAPKTLREGFLKVVQHLPHMHCLGWREYVGDNLGPYVWKTYATVCAEASAVAAALMAPTSEGGCGLEWQSIIGLYSKNVPEWMVCALACDMHGLISAPLYDTLGDDAVRYIMDQTACTVVVVHPEVVEKFLQTLEAGGAPLVKTVIVFNDTIAPRHRVDLDKLKAPEGVRVLGWKALIAIGQKQPPKEMRLPEPDTVAFICYTSGTTGPPKGAMLTNRSMLVDAQSLLLQALTYNCPQDPIEPLGPNDVHISYLPLAHVFERLIQTAMYISGARVGFYSGNVKTLVKDMQVLEPTVFASVPRFLNKLRDTIITRVDKQTSWSICGPPNPALEGNLIGSCYSQFKWPPPALRKKLFYMGFEAKKKLLPHNVNRHGFWDSTVFQAVKNMLGGRIRFCFTGSAPISPDVMNFLRIILSCPVVEGYGATETSAAATGARIDDMGVQHVGVPFSCNEIRLDEVEEMGYMPTDLAFLREDENGGTTYVFEPEEVEKAKTKDPASVVSVPRGEICIRGPNIFAGYYKDEEKTKAVKDEFGWYHSGDIGMWLPNGTLRIIDRKKNIFKLAQGEYVAPERIENVYLSSKLIAQVFVHGDSLQHQLVAIVVPDFDATLPLINKKVPRRKEREKMGTEPTADELAVCENAEVQQKIMADMERLAKEAGLKGFEKARAIGLHAEPFSVESGLLTASFKSKRPQLRSFYRPQIDVMYARLGKGERNVTMAIPPGNPGESKVFTKV